MPLRQLLYFALKAMNLVLGTALSFGLVYALIRHLPQDVYGVFILVSALGAYVLATDLGFSSVIFSRVRALFLAKRLEEARATMVGALTIYAGVVLVAQLAFCAALALGLIPAGWRLTFGIYFLTVLLSLPWNLIRAAAVGLEKFVLFECVEVARRAALVAFVFAMTKGMAFETYAWVAIVLWGLAYGGVAVVLFRLVGAPVRGDYLHARRVIADNRVQVGSAGTFALCEVVIYNFPYVAIPLVFHDVGALVAFDIFYKITRFGASAYLVANEGLLPAQTRAIHAGAGRAVLRNIGLGLAVSAIPCIVGILAVTWFGQPVFHQLLGDAARVPEPVRITMSVVLAAMLFRAASGTLLLNTGKADLLARVALIEVAAMGALTAATALSHATFQVFMWGYVIVFALISAGYFLLLGTRIRRMLKPAGVW